MNRIFNELKIMLSHHSKVFVLRFDLAMSEYTSDNKIMSEFNKALFPVLEKSYGRNVGFVWVREKACSDSQHYHMAIMLSGHKIRHSSKLFRLIQLTWSNLTGSRAYLPENPFYMVNSNDLSSIQAVIYRLSYLAKKETKGCRNNHAKDYQTSRLKLSHQS